MDDMLETHLQWLEAAREDLRLAHMLFEKEHDFFPPICFHCQQAVEKSLKAFLYFHRVDQELQNHRLEKLLKFCKEIDPNFEQFSASVAILDQYYLPTRYPDALPGISPSGIYQEQEAEEALKYAGEIFLFVEKRITKTSQ